MLLSSDRSYSPFPKLLSFPFSSKAYPLALTILNSLRTHLLSSYSCYFTLHSPIGHFALAHLHSVFVVLLSTPLSAELCSPHSHSISTYYPPVPFQASHIFPQGQFSLYTNYLLSVILSFTVFQFLSPFFRIHRSALKVPAAILLPAKLLFYL